MHLMVHLKIWKIQSYEHIQVPGGLDKQGPIVYTKYTKQSQQEMINVHMSSTAVEENLVSDLLPWQFLAHFLLIIKLKSTTNKFNIFRT